MNIGFNLFGYEFSLHKEKKKLHEIGAEAKKEQSWEKIKDGLDQIDKQQLDYSEYRLQQVSKVSINTIKKYRYQIAKYRGEANTNLFS
ncbi:MAG: hypothetical protein KAI79_16685 [Bacteroidales bacterium]|nr:hypothetical protein [Bacteroidales bacterium]